MFPQTGGLRRPICTYATCKTAEEKKTLKKKAMAHSLILLQAWAKDGEGKWSKL